MTFKTLPAVQPSLLILVITFGVVASGCAEADPAPTFCERLDRACGFEHDDRAKSLCDRLTTLEDLEHPACVDARDEMLRCMSGFEMACPDPASVFAGATSSGDHIYRTDGVEIAVGEACVAAGDAWDRCRHCPVAIEAIAEGGAECAAERRALASCIEDGEPRCPFPWSVELDGADATKDLDIVTYDMDRGRVTFHTRGTCLAELEAVQACECELDDERTWLPDASVCEYDWNLWTCDLSFYEDGECDCGCGAMDPDCASAALAACEYCTGCGCDELDPKNNAVCR